MLRPLRICKKMKFWKYMSSLTFWPQFNSKPPQIFLKRLNKDLKWPHNMYWCFLIGYELRFLKRRSLIKMAYYDIDFMVRNFSIKWITLVKGMYTSAVHTQRCFNERLYNVHITLGRRRITLQWRCVRILMLFKKQSLIWNSLLPIHIIFLAVADIILSPLLALQSQPTGNFLSLKWTTLNGTV